MTAMPEQIPSKHDPRYLRVMMDRANELARSHGVSSVFVGIAGREGDLLAPEFIEFVESALRIEDDVFRLLRERAVLLLTDVDREQAEAVLERLRADFATRFAPSAEIRIGLGYCQVDPGPRVATAKDVLPEIFSGGV
jgi:hypothetical protein